MTRRLDNEYLEREAARLRASTGAEIIDRRNAARPLLKALSEKAVVVILPDQAVLPREGVLVPFLGRPAWTTPAPAKLAVRHDSPIVFAFCIPQKTRHRLEFVEPIRVDQLTEEERDPVALTTRINDVISRRITAHPELWLWMHDRWKGTGKAKSQMGSRAETVVIGLNWVGDNILALPTYRALQHRYRAEGGIALAAPENVSSLLASSGLFKKVIAWNGDTRDRIRTLRNGKFRRAVILPNSFRAAMMAFAAGIGERWGYSTDCRRLLLTHHRRAR